MRLLHCVADCPLHVRVMATTSLMFLVGFPIEFLMF